MAFHSIGLKQSPTAFLAFVTILAASALITPQTASAAEVPPKTWEFDWNPGFRAYDLEHPPIVADNGRVYLILRNVGGGFPGPNASSRIIALSPAGNTLWRFQKDQAFTSAAVTPNGTLVFGATDDELYALSPNGHIRWTDAFSVGEGRWSGPQATDLGLQHQPMIYFVTGKTLHAESPLGRTRWQVSLNRGKHDEIRHAKAWLSGPVKQTLYVNMDGNLQAIGQLPDPSRIDVKWAFNDTVDSQVLGKPAVAPDGTVYVASREGDVYAITRSGDMRWHSGTGRRIDHSLTRAPNGTIYAITHHNKTNEPSFSYDSTILFAFSPSGDIKWKLDLTKHLGRIAQANMIPIGDDGGLGIAAEVIVKNTFEVAVCGVNGSGNLAWQRTCEKGEGGGRETRLAHIPQLAVDHDETLYIGGTSLHALDIGQSQ